MNVSVPGPSQLYVRWGCRRCGFTGGVAKTTIPVDQQWNEEMVRHLFDVLRLKLVKKHQSHLFQKSGRVCVPVPSDFDIERYVAPQSKPQVRGLV